MSEQVEISRRGVLGGGAGLAAVALLALTGCGASGAPHAAGTVSPDELPTGTTPPSSPGTAAPSSTPSSAASSLTAPSTAAPSTAAASRAAAHPSAPPHPAAPANTQAAPPAAAPPAPAAPPPAPPAVPPPAAPPAAPTPPPSSSPVVPAGALAQLSAIPLGGSISATQAGKPITLARPSVGTVAAFSAICTHQGCTVNAGGPRLHCPCHGSIYNAFTGAVIQGPAPASLPAVTVHVVDGYVVSG